MERFIKKDKTDDDTQHELKVLDRCKDDMDVLDRIDQIQNETVEPIVQHEEELPEDENAENNRRIDNADKPNNNGDKDNNDDVDSQNVIPAVLMFKDIGYLEYDKMSQLATVSQKLRTKLITCGASAFQNAEGPFAIVNGHSTTSANLLMGRK